MLFEPFCKGSTRFSYVFFSTHLFFALISVNDSTLAVNGIIVLGSHEEAFDGLSSFKMYLYPILAACFFDSLTEALMIWNHHVQFLIVSVAWALLIVYSSLFCSAGFWLFSFALFMAYMGYLHFLSALNRCCSSSCNSVVSEHMVFALWYRVPATLYLDGILWWLSHCRYRSV